MTERDNAITLGGNPVTLVGAELKPGDRAPDFTVVDRDMNTRTLADYAGKPLLVSVVPSLDTSICDLQTRRFNNDAVGLGQDVVVLTVSMDLPFAQKRWCGAAGMDQVVTLSDHREASFGAAWGVLIKEVRLLARSVFVVDRQGTVTYTQLVPEVGTEPDFEEALEALKKVA